MNKLLMTCLVFAVGTFSITAIASPGEYWEVTSKMEMAGMPFSMPAHTMRVCLPKERRVDPHRAVPNKNCQMTDIEHSGNRTSWKVRCNQNGEVMYGSGDIVNSANSYHGTMRVHGRAEGTPMNMVTHFSGRRLGQSCEARN